MDRKAEKIFGFQDPNLEYPPKREEIPIEFAHKPALHIYWNGLAISITEGFMTRKQAYDMLARMDAEDGVEPHPIIDLPLAES